MTAYEAKLRIDGEPAAPMPVVVDLIEDHLHMKVGDQEVADWARDEMRIDALPDGFHIRVDGESIVLDVTDDAHFAIDLGLRTAHPALRRRMSAILREDDHEAPSGE